MSLQHDEMDTTSPPSGSGTSAASPPEYATAATLRSTPAQMSAAITVDLVVAAQVIFMLK